MTASDGNGCWLVVFSRCGLQQIHFRFFSKVSTRNVEKNTLKYLMLPVFSFVIYEKQKYINI